MATTSNTFTGDGSTTNYSFTFEYLEQDEVKVTLTGVPTTAFTFANATTISFNSAPANGTEIRIYRDTDIDTLKATFFPGSAIKAEDLNNNFTQNNFVVQELQNSTWDVDLQTIKSNEAWVSSDDQIATTAAMDQRFQDEAAETILSTETWVADDDHIATTQAIEDRIDEVITNDIGTDGTGITVTDDGDGTITLGLAANSIDFDRIKNVDIITEAEQDAGSPVEADTNLFTSLAAAKRFDTIVDTVAQSTAVNWEVGKTWLQNDSEKTVRIWDGSAWVAVASGGSFTTLSKVVYVDSVNGDDSLEGHRISNPKKTIKAAIQQINSETDAVGDGSVVIVAPGVYQEVAPIDIQKKNVSIIGQALRSCIVHPTVATQENTLFRLNSGSYIANLTLTGVKASGTRGGNPLDTDSTYGLPTNQGWNFAFYPNATIVKSPYIANCTNFSDSEIDNSNLNAFNPAGGLGGDTDSAPTGGGILVDGAAVNSNSPLRSMVCDSYTHVGLDGPGIFVTNNGYCQATSSYAFFTHYHIKTLNGGQANLAASTTDFGRYGLIAQGRSSSAIFTATTTVNASSGATTFTIGAPSAGANWFGSATRPQSNMVVDIGGNTYSIIGATANGSGWDVEISRPDPNNLSTNLGLNGAVNSGSAVSFYLRSMIASSGHTMEYVGSGTNYSALPENGGVPIEANEIIELSNGKVWAATTNHQGKFTVGPTFNVDQVTGYVNIANGAIGIEKLIEDLDLNSFTLSDSTGDVTIDDQMDMNTHKIVNVVDPTSAQDAATKNYVDTSSANTNYVAVTGDSMTGDLNMGTNTVTGLGAPSAASDAATKSYVDAVDTAKLDKAGDTMTGNLTMNAQSDVRFADADSSNYVALQAPATIGTNYTLTLPNSVGNVGEALITDASGNLSWSSNVTTTVDQLIEGDTKVEAVDTGANGEIQFTTDGTRAMTIDSNQRVGIGTTSPSDLLHIQSTSPVIRGVDSDNSAIAKVNFGSGNITLDADVSNTAASSIINFKVDGAERLRVNSSGYVGIGTSSPGHPLDVRGRVRSSIGTGTGAGGAGYAFYQFGTSATATENWHIGTEGDGSFRFYNQGFGAGLEKVRITSAGNVGIGTTSPSSQLTVGGNPPTTGAIAAVGSSGGIALALSDNVNSSLYVRNASGGSVIGTDAGGNIRFATNGNGTADEKVRIDSSGRVGIGTSSPAGTLNVQGSTAAASLTYNTANIANFDAGTIQLALGVHDAAPFGAYLQGRDTGNGSRVISLNPAGGFVGIGTTSPDRLLHLFRGSAGTAVSDNNTVLMLENSTHCILQLASPNNVSNRILFGDPQDADVGMLLYDHNTNNFGIHVNASERIRIDSSGNVGIGTNNPTAPFVVSKDSSLNFTGNYDIVAAFTNTAGNRGLGVLYNDTDVRAGLYPLGSGSDISFFTPIIDTYSEKVRIADTATYFLSSAGSPNKYFDYNDNAVLYSIRSGTGIENHIRFYNANGQVGRIYTNGSVTVFATQSDYRLKENVTPVTDGIARLQQLKPSRFNFIADPDTVVDGFLAHEVQDIVPEAIGGDKDAVDENGDPEYQSIDQSKLVPLLTAALQEAIGRIETLEAEVAALKAG